jgi:hypothetical protein
MDEQKTASWGCLLNITLTLLSNDEKFLIRKVYQNQP